MAFQSHMFSICVGAWSDEPQRITCLHPRVIVNRRYTSQEVPSWNFAGLADYYLQVPCGRCYLCKKRLANDWRVRLEMEMRTTRTHKLNGSQVPRVIFTTLTIAEEHYTDDDRYFAEYFRKFRDNYRKRYGISPRYYAITDRGSQFARLHIHMLLFDPRVYDRNKREYVRNISLKELVERKFWWPYGMVRYTKWVKAGSNCSTYVSGYISGANLDKDEPVKHGKPICDKALRYKPRVFVSNGLGRDALADYDTFMRWREEGVVQIGGYHFGLPRYYQMHLYTAWERYYRLIYDQAEREWQMQRTAVWPESVRYQLGQHTYNRQSLERHIRDLDRFTTPLPKREKFEPTEFPESDSFYPSWYTAESHYSENPFGPRPVYYYNDINWLNDHYFMNGYTDSPPPF